MSIYEILLFLLRLNFKLIKETFGKGNSVQNYILFKISKTKVVEV